MAAGLTAPELRELSADELASKLREHKEELFNLRFQVATGQLDNNRRLQTVRRDIARIYTIMRENELGIEFPRPPASEHGPHRCLVHAEEGGERAQVRRRGHIGRQFGFVRSRGRSRSTDEECEQENEPCGQTGRTNTGDRGMH